MCVFFTAQAVRRSDSAVHGGSIAHIAAFVGEFGEYFADFTRNYAVGAGKRGVMQKRRHTHHFVCRRFMRNACSACTSRSPARTAAYLPLAPHADGFDSAGFPAPQAEPHAAGFFSGSLAPQAEAGFCAGLSADFCAPHAVPQAAPLSAAAFFSFQSARFESAIIITPSAFCRSCDVVINIAQVNSEKKNALFCNLANFALNLRFVVVSPFLHGGQNRVECFSEGRERVFHDFGRFAFYFVSNDDAVVFH